MLAAIELEESADGHAAASEVPGKQPALNTVSRAELKKDQATTAETQSEAALQWKQSLVTFTQMLWSFDLDLTMQGFIGSEAAAGAYLAFLTRASEYARERAETRQSTSARPARAAGAHRIEALAADWATEFAMPSQLAGRLLVESDASIDAELFRFMQQVLATQRMLQTASTREEHDQVVATEGELAKSYATLLGPPLEEAQGDTARERLAQMAADGLAALAASPLLEGFVSSAMSRPLIHQLLRMDTMASDRRTLESEARTLLWDAYAAPADAAGWLLALASVGETLPACIVIADMSMKGNPMVYVNPEFCRVTGYTKAEAQGRSCRFLQGPRTEPAAVATIQDALRRGSDCHVRITNYRKSGETFSNLLMLRPVRDVGAPNGPCRFCIGVQFEVTRSRSGMEARLHRLSRLMALLPTTLPAPPGGGTGAGSKRERLAQREDATSYMLRMSAALNEPHATHEGGATTG